MNPYAYAIERPDALPIGQPAPHGYPAIVFLHGAGEVGGDAATRVRVHGPWKKSLSNGAVDRRLGQYFVIAPHLPAGPLWEDQRVLDTLCSAFGEMKQSHGDHVVNIERVFVTGVSLGGRGALEVAARGFPDPQNAVCDPSIAQGLPFRAAAIICPLRDSAAGLRAPTRYQFFHRDHDSNGPTRDTYGALQNPPAARFHRYKGCNHNCWTATYANPALYDWLDDPGTEQQWGEACDASMCVAGASELVEVRKASSGKPPFSASFCPAHAAQFTRWTKYGEYISKVP